VFTPVPEYPRQAIESVLMGTIREVPTMRGEGGKRGHLPIKNSSARRWESKKIRSTIGMGGKWNRF